MYYKNPHYLHDRNDSEIDYKDLSRVENYIDQNNGIVFTMLLKLQCYITSRFKHFMAEIHLLIGIC